LGRIWNLSSWSNFFGLFCSTINIWQKLSWVWAIIHSYIAIIRHNQVDRNAVKRISIRFSFPGQYLILMSNCWK
jgi:hypothetical protein